MSSIAIFYLPKLTEERQAEFLALSDVGNKEFIESGITEKHHRLRYVDLTELQAVANVWTHSDPLVDDSQADYINRITNEIVTAMGNLKLGSIDAIWMDEAIYNQVSQQSAFKNL